MKSSIMIRAASLMNDYANDDDDGDSSVLEDDMNDENPSNPAGTHISRSTQPRSSTSVPNNNNVGKRQKDISPCYVCGAKAHGYNFDQITCESCKAFFRRNALKSMDRFRCRNNDNCVITTTTRKRCKRCRLAKCFKVGMRKEWILTEEEKRLKRKKIERNRLLKQQAQLGLQQKQMISNELIISPNSGRISTSSGSDLSPSSSDHQRHLAKRNSSAAALPLPIMCMYPASERQLYEPQKLLLVQLSEGYHAIIRQYPQPNKFPHRKHVIQQTEDMETKLFLVKDLTRELTQMTTSRLLNYFNLIPEFRALNDSEKRCLLVKNMLTVFMFHGALTYDSENDVFVDRNTADHPYDAKYLLLVYGSRVYQNFVNLARGLTAAAYQSLPHKGSDERTHNLFLLLMNVLLFTDHLDPNAERLFSDHQRVLDDNSSRVSVSRSLSTTSESSSSVSSVSSSSSTSSRFGEKLQKIQNVYIEIACRYLFDEFGLAIGRQLFQNLLPLLHDLHKLCSTLANVNLCESAEAEDRSLASSHSSRAITGGSRAVSYHASTTISSENGNHSNSNYSTTFNPTMISGRSHLNELQKENRAPIRSNQLQSSLSSNSNHSRSAFGNASIPSPSSSLILSDTIAALENHRLS